MPEGIGYNGEDIQTVGNRNQIVRRGVRRDPELYNRIVAAYERSKKYIKERKIFEKIERYKKMYENSPWEAHNTRRSGNLSEVKVAIAFDVIETGLPIATARPPMPDLKPDITADNEEFVTLINEIENAQNDLEKRAAEEKLEDFKDNFSNYAIKMQRELVKTWKESSMQAKSREAYREKGKTGTAFVKSVYNPKTDKIDTTPIDFTTIFPSPDKDSIEAHADGDIFIYSPIISTRSARKKFNIEQIDEDAIGDYDGEKFSFRHDIGYMGRIQAALKAKLDDVIGKKPKNKAEADGHVVLIEAYMSDDGELEFEDNVYDDDGIQQVVNNMPITIKKKKPKFRSGYKRVTIIKDNKDWILEEVENIYKRPPFWMNKGYGQQGDFWGVTVIQMIEDLIMRMNVSSSNVNDNLRMTGNPIMVEVQGSVTEGEEIDNSPTTNRIGGKMTTPVAGGVYYLQPPSLGIDVKWWTEFLRSWIDRISHLSDAMRGINEFSGDSGKKIQQLRLAAAGAFQPVLDEQIEYSVDLFKHWIWINQNLRKVPILQKVDDEQGNTNFELFEPNQGADIKLIVDVSSESILPRDPNSEWEEGLTLWNIRLPSADGGERGAISIEHLIDLAPTISDKSRIKKYNAVEQEKLDAALQKQQLFEQFMQLAAEVSEALQGGEMDSEALDEGVVQLAQIVSQAPEILITNEFKALPHEIRLAIMGSIVGNPQEDTQTEQVQPVEVS